MTPLSCRLLAIALAGATTLVPVARSSAAGRAGADEDARYGAANLLARGRSKAAGAVIILPDVANLRLGLSVTGLKPKTTYNVLIYSGASCANSTAGTVQQILPDLTTDAQGNAVSITTLPVQGVPPTGWYLDVPVAQKDQTKTPGPGVVCGAIHQVGVDVELRQPDMRYTAEGNVLVTRHITRQGTVDMARTLGTELAVYAAKLRPRQQYKMRIVTGRCGGSNPTKYRLASLHSNASGEAIAITYLPVSLPPGDLAVEVADARGRIATCGNFPGYGLTQAEVQ